MSQIHTANKTLTWLQDTGQLGNPRPYTEQQLARIVHNLLQRIMQLEAQLNVKPQPAIDWSGTLAQQRQFIPEKTVETEPLIDMARAAAEAVNYNRLGERIMASGDNLP